MQPTTHPRIPALDGLRGLAVGGVLAFHAGFGWAKGGFLGVSLFFTLSGFLICSLLVAERDADGRVDLRRFWARRARRLLPAAIVALLVVILFGATAAGEGQLRDLQGDVLAALGYAANWRFVLEGATYADLWSGPSPVQHFWSLAIEEQFYVAFPLVVVLARRRLGLVLVAGIALSLLSLTMIDGDLRAYYGTDARAAEILVGALLAVVLRGRAPGLAASRAATVAGTAALALVVASWATVATGEPALYGGGLAVHAVLVAVVIATVRAPGPLASALSLPPLRWLGRISYGAYLYHWPLFLWLTPVRTGIDGTSLAVTRIATSLLLAELSYRLLEEPIRSGRRLTPHLGRVALVGGAAAVVLGVVAVTPPQRADDVVFALTAGTPSLVAPSTTSSTATTSTTVPAAPGAPAGVPTVIPWHEGEPLRVYVAGDSNAFALGVALAKWSEGKGIEIWTSGWFACHLVRGGEYRFAAEPPKATEPTCNDWVTTRTKDLDQIRPHVTLIHMGAFDLLDRRLAGSSTWRHVGQRGYDSLLRTEMERFTDLVQERGSRLLWTTYPGIEAGRVDGVPPEQEFPENAPLRIGRYNRLIREVVASNPGAELLDIRSWYQTWEGGELALEHRPDGLHPSKEKLRELALWVAPHLLERANRS